MGVFNLALKIEKYYIIFLTILKLNKNFMKITLNMILGSQWLEPLSHSFSPLWEDS